jgi:alanine racemase
MSIHRCWAEIDHAALRHNASAVRCAIGDEPEILAVVKADGYGHGGPEVARTWAPFAAQFGAATLGEALAISAAVPGKDILLLSPCLPGEREDVVREGFIPVVSSTAEAKAYAPTAGHMPVRIHLCLDTGMGRIGLWQEEALAGAWNVADLQGIEVESVSTHLPVADSDAAFTEGELQVWGSLVADMRKIFPGAKFHALNSAASFKWPSFAADRVRPGLALYGISPLPEFQQNLRPAMTLKTRITLVREVGAGRGISYGRDFITPRPMRIATLALGYADGYPRQTSNRSAQVLVRGQRCPILGRITMDQMMIDISTLPRDVAPGEEVVLFGNQQGHEITVSEVAAWSGTIAWDIITRLGRRVILEHRNRD